LVVIAETEDDLIKRHNKWKDNVENRLLHPFNGPLSGTTWVSWYQKGTRSPAKARCGRPYCLI